MVKAPPREITSERHLHHMQPYANRYAPIRARIQLNGLESLMVTEISRPFGAL